LGDLMRHVIRLVVSALVLMVVGFLVPGFDNLGFINALIAAAVIAVAGYLIEALLGRNVSPYGRGIVGFIISAIVIWGAQYLVPGMSVSIFGALIAAFVIGIIDMFVPTSLR
jgi:putative membrane protein